MNGPTLKLLRQSLWLSQNEAARLNGVALRTYRDWELRGYGRGYALPDDVEQRMMALDATMRRMADHGLAEFDAMAAMHGKPDCLTLLRYDTDEDLWRYRRDLAGIPASAHAAGIDRLRQRIERERHGRVRIILMQHEAYQAWLGIRQDTATTRAEWATLQPYPQKFTPGDEPASGER